MLGERVGCLVPPNAHEKEVCKNHSKNAHDPIWNSIAKLNLGCHDQAEDYEFVAGEADELHELWVAKIEATNYSFLDNWLENPAEEELRKSVGDLGCVELLLLPVVEACQEQVSHKRHKRNVKVRCLQVILGGVAWGYTGSIYVVIVITHGRVHTTALPPFFLLDQEW